MGAAKLLIVEDEVLIAFELEGRLQTLGYHILGIACSGKEALKLIEDDQPDLVLMDIVLKGEIDGISTAEAISHRWSIPIIYLTAYTDEATLLRAKETKPYGYLLKPYSEAELHANIKMALHKHELETQFLDALETANLYEPSTFLDQTCARDPTLRRLAETLIRKLTETTTFQLQPSLQMSPPAQGQSGGNRLTCPSAPAEKTDLSFLTRSANPGFLCRLDNYEVIKLIGRGANGFVFKAFDDTLHRIVAIKVLAPQLAHEEMFRKRFLREARAMAAIRNDYVIDVFAVGEAQGIPYFVMEFIAGVSLMQWLSANKQPELDSILRIGQQVASGLAAAHDQGLIHRDIKPSNILMENSIERVKITDFGLARAMDDAHQTHVGTILGTPQFMAPEQASGEPLDHRSDLFSLGSVFYAMCTGQMPFQGQTTYAVLMRVCQDAPPPIREINPEIPDWLVEIISKLHAKKPEERFQSAKDVVSALSRRKSGA